MTVILNAILFEVNSTLMHCENLKWIRQKLLHCFRFCRLTVERSNLRKTSQRKNVLFLILVDFQAVITARQKHAQKLWNNKHKKVRGAILTDLLAGLHLCHQVGIQSNANVPNFVAVVLCSSPQKE